MGGTDGGGGRNAHALTLPAGLELWERKRGRASAKGCTSTADVRPTHDCPTPRILLSCCPCRLAAAPTGVPRTPSACQPVPSASCSPPSPRPTSPGQGEPPQGPPVTRCPSPPLPPAWRQSWARGAGWRCSSWWQRRGPSSPHPLPSRHSSSSISDKNPASVRHPWVSHLRLTT